MNMKCQFPYVSKTGCFIPCCRCYACKSSQEVKKHNEMSKTFQG